VQTILSNLIKESQKNLNLYPNEIYVFGFWKQYVVFTAYK